MSPIVSSIAATSAKGFGFGASSQNLNFWLSYFTESTPDTVNCASITLDSSGNIYTAGSFYNASAASNAFLAKHNSSGVLQWQRFLTDANPEFSQFDTLDDTITDSAGNVYATGEYVDSISSNTYFYVVKYNSTGTLQWQKSISTPIAWYDYARIAIDASSNVYVSTNFYNASNGINALITKYNSAGTLQWQRSLADANTAANQLVRPKAILTDSLSNVYVVGQFKNTSGGSNSFIIKYDTSGNILWQRSLASALSGGLTASEQVDSAEGISIDSSGNVFVTGTFTHKVGSSIGTKIYIAKYNASGVIQWQVDRGLAPFISVGSDRSMGIANDSLGNIYIIFKVGTSGGYVGIQKFNSAGTSTTQILAYNPNNGSAAPNSSKIFINSSNIVHVSGTVVADSTTTPFPYQAGLIYRVPSDLSIIKSYTLKSDLHYDFFVPTLAVQATGTLTESAGILTGATPTITIGNSNLASSSGTLLTGTTYI